MKRTKLCDRALPAYSVGEETMNMVSHIIGGGFSVVFLCLSLYKTLSKGGTFLLCAIIYCVSMIVLYAMSSIYHGLKCGTAKKVMQVLDHCTIYALIAGTYTPIVLCAIAPQYPMAGWVLFISQWILAAIAATLTAIDLKRYRILSMVCYIGMGWEILFFLPQTFEVLTPPGFWLLFSGGIAYTVGAVLFGLGKRVKWMHSVFHIFVVIGSILQFLCILFYVF